MTGGPASADEAYDVLHGLAGALWDWRQAVGGREVDRCARIGVQVSNRSGHVDVWPVAVDGPGAAALRLLLADDAAARSRTRTDADEAADPRQAAAVVQRTAAALAGHANELAAAAAAGDRHAWDRAVQAVAELAAGARVAVRQAHRPAGAGLQGELFAAEEPTP